MSNVRLEYLSKTGKLVYNGKNLTYAELVELHQGLHKDNKLVINSKTAGRPITEAYLVKAYLNYIGNDEIVLDLLASYVENEMQDETVVSVPYTNRQTADDVVLPRGKFE